MHMQLTIFTMTDHHCQHWLKKKQPSSFRFTSPSNLVPFIHPFTTIIAAYQAEVQSTKSLAWQKGFRLGSGLISKVLGQFATSRQPASTCMREWGSGGGARRDFMIGCPLAAASLLCPAQFRLTGGFHLILRFEPSLIMIAGLVVLLSRFVSGV